MRSNPGNYQGGSSKPTRSWSGWGYVGVLGVMIASGIGGMKAQQGFEVRLPDAAPGTSKDESQSGVLPPSQSSKPQTSTTPKASNSKPFNHASSLDEPTSLPENVFSPAPTPKYTAVVNSIDGEVKIGFPVAFTENSEYIKGSSDQKSIVRYDGTDGETRYHFSLWKREGNNLNALSADEQQSWLNNIARSIYGSQSPRDTVPLTIGQYPGVAMVYDLPANGRVSRARMFLTGQLAIVVTVSNPEALDVVAESQAISFLKSLDIKSVNDEVNLESNSQSSTDGLAENSQDLNVPFNIPGTNNFGYKPLPDDHPMSEQSHYNWERCGDWSGC